MNNNLTYIYDTYKEYFPIKQDESIAKYTTVKLGGIARLFINVTKIFSQEQINHFHDAQNKEDVLKAIEQEKIPFVSLLQDLKRLSIPYYIIGGGSDVLFSDKPYDGVVIKLNAGNHTDMPDFQFADQIPSFFDHISRHKKIENPDQNHDLTFDDLFFEEITSHPIPYFAEAGVMLSFFIQYTLAKHISGMHWFSHIPASIGGAIFNNIHGGKVMFSNYVGYVILLDEGEHIQIVANEDMHFSYDDSRIQHTQETVLGVILRLFVEDDEEIQKAKYFSDTWITQKIQVQPKFYSAGSTFKNLTEEQRQLVGNETNSAGYLIDKAGLKGYQIGGAQIYEEHGNFFINKENATAAEYKALIDFAIKTIQEKYGITIEPEIKLVNF